MSQAIRTMFQKALKALMSGTEPPEDGTHELTMEGKQLVATVKGGRVVGLKRPEK